MTPTTLSSLQLPVRLGCCRLPGSRPQRSARHAGWSCTQAKAQPTQVDMTPFDRKAGRCPVTRLGQVLGLLGITGASAGTLLDGIHSKVQLLIYDKMPIDLGNLPTSLAVPPLLASFYVVLGGLVLWADYRLSSDVNTQQALRRSDSLFLMVTSFGALAAMLEVSSYLYSNGVSYDLICWALAGLAAANYLLFDGTKQGLVLALLCATVAPASELVLMQHLGLWHYPEANMLTAVAGGIPSWVPWCYFFYVPAVANLSRFLWRMM